MLPLLVPLLLTTATGASAQQTLNLSLPSSLPSTAQPLSPFLISFSFELSFVDEFLGNATSPNKLVLDLIGNIADRTGGVGFRPGGISVDSSIYSPSVSPEPLVRDLSETGGIYRTTYGPAFFDSLQLLPNSTMFTLDVNFGNNSWEIARDQAEAGLKALAGRVENIELGNEPDQYSNGSRNLATWGPEAYTAEFLSWSTNLTSNLSLPDRFFQAGAFAMDPDEKAKITTKDVVNLGIANTSLVQTFSQHMYQYSTCDPARNELATLSSLVNHTNITAYVDLWKPQIAAAQSVGAEFVIGEFNSVSCSGKQNVSNTFGQALWLADTILYSASLGISRMYSHQGATLVLQSATQANKPGYSWYDFVYPLPSERNGPAQSTPSYPGYLLIAEAIAPLSLPGPFTAPSINPNTASSSSLRIFAHNLTDEPDLAVYEVWSTSGPAYEDAPIRVVMLNLSPEPRNVSILSNSFPSTSSSNSTTTSSITYKRLRSSEGVASTNASAATWAGQTFLNGTASGEEVIETLEGETVNVGAYEGVVVFLEGGNGSTAATSTGTGGGGASLPVVSATATTAAVKTSWGGSKMRKPSISALPVLILVTILL